MMAYASNIGSQWFVVKDGKARLRSDRWSALIEACILNRR
jgi:hypothetical protein